MAGVQRKSDIPVARCAIRVTGLEAMRRAPLFLAKSKGGGNSVLVLKDAGLVYLANPKTATQSLRAILAPFAGATPEGTSHRHINAPIYARKWAGRVANDLGRAPQTFAVTREPLEHLDSWHRYRQRDAIRGHQNSTHGIGFADFIDAVLMDDPPPFARIGRQARFMGFLDDVPPVDFIFDYAQLELLIAFLNQRLSTTLKLPRRNVSPQSGAAVPDLPDAVMARLKLGLAAEFDLYARVACAGVLGTVLAPRSTRD